MALHRARQRGEVAVMSGDDVRPAEFIDALWRLHRDRWRSRGEGGVLDDMRVRAFHSAALPRLAAAGLSDLRLLDIGGVIAGAYLGLRDARRSYAYLGGFDPSFSRESPGAVLLGSAIEAAVRRGAEEFDFLRGRESYKYSWGAVDRPQGWRRMVPEHGVG
jgi:CelD/BcsL family acetyltransferase involved in cellulose biosynthesis